MESKERIMQKAADLFMRYGIRSITMDEIASQLGISKKTIYHFFADKDSMVEAIVHAEMQNNESKCLRFQENAENAIHEIFIAVKMKEEMLKAMNPLIMYDMEKHHPKAFKIIRDYKYQFMHGVTIKNLERGVKEELYRQGMHTDIIAKYRVESVFLGFNQDIFPASKYNMSEVGYELEMFFLHAISTAKGKKLIEKYSLERKNKQRSYE